MRWPWVSREMLDQERLEREALRSFMTSLLDHEREDSHIEREHHARELEFERTRWMALINAERARADKATDMLMAMTSPSGNLVRFQPPADPNRKRTPLGRVDMEAIAEMAQRKADKAAAAIHERFDDSLVPGMTDPFPPEPAQPEEERDAAP